MICLDTNYLILGLVADSREAQRLVEWNRAGEPLYAPMVVWYEFLCGPVDAAQVATMKALLQRVHPFDEAQAEEAVRLFNAIGRRRQLRVDAMIAAAAISCQAPLATGNEHDFQPFTDHGLELMR